MRLRFTLDRALGALKSPEARSVLGMTVPIAAEQAFITLMAIVIAGMAGHAGTEIASGVALVAAMVNVVSAILGAIALGGTVAVSRAIGAGNREDADQGAAQAIGLSVASAGLLGFGLCIAPDFWIRLLYSASSEKIQAAAGDFLFASALGFPFIAATLSSSAVLRGTGDARTPMAANILMNVVNVAAGFIFIFGVSFGAAADPWILIPPMGALGAGIAITLARGVGTLYFIAAFARGKGSFRFPRPSWFLRPSRFFRGPFAGDRFIADRTVFATIMKVSVPAAVESLAFNGGKLLTQTYIAGLSAVDMAADYITFSTAMFTQVPLSSISMAVPPLVGIALGRREPLRARKIIMVSVLMGCLFMAFVSILTFPFVELVLSFSSSDPAVVRRGAQLFRPFLLLCPLFWATSFIVPSGLRGAGDGRYTMTVAVVSMWTVRVGLGWALAYPMGLGIQGVWFAMMTDWVVRSTAYVARLRGDRWMRSLD